MQPQFSLERIVKLISDLEQELSNAPPGSAKIDALRSELDTIKRMLSKPDGELHEAHETHELNQQLHSLRTRVDELLASVEGEVMKDTPYLAELGRILGLM